MNITIKEYQSTNISDFGLQNLLSMHTEAKYGEAESMVEQLKSGESISIQIAEQASAGFLRGLKNYKLKYDTPQPASI